MWAGPSAGFPGNLTLFPAVTGNRLWQPGWSLAGRHASSDVWWGVAPEPSLRQTCKRPYPLNRGSPTFLAPGTSFLEDSLPTDQGSGGTVSVSPAGHVLPFGRFRTGQWPIPVLGPWLGDPCIEPLVCAWALTFVSYYNTWPHMLNISKRPYKKENWGNRKPALPSCPGIPHLFYQPGLIKEGILEMNELCWLQALSTDFCPELNFSYWVRDCTAWEVPNRIDSFTVESLGNLRRKWMLPPEILIWLAYYTMLLWVIF